MKVAVIGAGGMGGMHADLLAAMDEVDDLFVVDADAARAGEVARHCGGVAAAFEEAVRVADAVVVATPPEFHYGAVSAAIEGGRHVLCEKPLTEALASTIELTRRVEAEGAHVEIGFQRRHDAAFVAAREAIRGRLHLVKLTAHDPLFPAPSLSGPAPEAAPIFRDSSVHDFDLVRWLCGQEVTEVHAEAVSRDGSMPRDPREIESAVVSMRLSDGTLAVLDASWLHPSGYDIRVELVAEGAAVSAGLSPRSPVRAVEGSDPADPWQGYHDRFADAYRAELRDFLACCRTAGPPASTARDGLEAMRVAVAATRSAIERRSVSLDEIPGLSRAPVA
ncbi:MAG: Gfo/Idh/MocA family oxidoreductase [Candidatus Limnocylindria bacterium]